MFLVFGLNGFLNFIPVPKDIPADTMVVMGSLMKAGYMDVVSGTEIIVGVSPAQSLRAARSRAARADHCWNPHLPYLYGTIEHRAGHRCAGYGTLFSLGLSRCLPSDAQSASHARRAVTALEEDRITKFAELQKRAM